jgi:hypothetical protein
MRICITHGAFHQSVTGHFEAVKVHDVFLTSDVLCCVW